MIITKKASASPHVSARPGHDAGAAACWIPWFRRCRPPSAAAKPVVRLGFVYDPNGMIMDRLDAGGGRHGLRVHAHDEGAGAVPRPASWCSAGWRRSTAARSATVPATMRAPAPRGSPASIRRRPKARAFTRGISADQIAAKEFGKTRNWRRSRSASRAPSWPAAATPAIAARTRTRCPGARPTTPLPLEINPRAVFERLFGDGDSTDPAARLARLEGAAQHPRLRRGQHRPAGDEARIARPQQAQRVSGSDPRHRAAHPESRTAERHR